MALLTSEIQEFVKQQKLGFVATVCPDGTPNLSPKGTTTVWDDDHLVFADIHSPGTIENLLRNPAVEVNVVDIFLRKGYRFKGVGKVLPPGPLFEKVVPIFKALGTKYIIKNVVLIKVEKVVPVLSPVYDNATSEQVVVKRWSDYWGGIYWKK